MGEAKRGKLIGKKRQPTVEEIMDAFPYQSLLARAQGRRIQ